MNGMQLTGSQIVIECLKEQGVDTVFGYPGGAILNVYDELYKHKDEITHILTSHEQGAAHAADGYARATGKVGVCMATSGPGATNLVTGIATAYMDSIPMVAITANVAVPLLGRDSFQEIDITGVTMPITKHNYIVKDITKLADTIREAFRIAQEGRPGPVLVDITKDVTAAETEYVKEEPIPVERSTQYIKEKDLEQAIELINESEKPFVFVGGGAVISGASKELMEFVKKIDAPVADSLMGKGAFDGTDELYMGMLGMHGTKASNLGVTKCDLLITVGSRFSDRVIGNASRFAKNAKILQIDVDPAEINKNIQVDCSIIGDLKEVLTRLNQRIDDVVEVIKSENKPKTPKARIEDKILASGKAAADAWGKVMETLADDMEKGKADQPEKPRLVINKLSENDTLFLKRFREGAKPLFKYCIDNDPSAEATDLFLSDNITDFINSWKFEYREIEDYAFRTLVKDAMDILSEYTYYLSDQFLRLIPGRNILWFRNESWEEGEQLRKVLQPESYRLRCEIRDLYLRLYPLPEEDTKAENTTIIQQQTNVVQNGDNNINLTNNGTINIKL